MNINHLTFSGNLVRPVELRTVGADKCVAKFTVANNSRYKNAAGEQCEEATFLECAAWGRQGEVAAQYLIQGSPVIVEGQLRTDKWTDKEGGKREKIVLRVERVHLVGSKGEKSADAAERPTPAPARPVAPAGAGADSDIPF